MIAVTSKAPRRTQGGKQTAEPVTRPAPIGGWNSEDPKQAMPFSDAIKLVNWFPRQRDVVSRPGWSVFCDLGTGLPVRRLMPFEYGASTHLIAASGGSLFDATTSSPSTLKTGCNNDYWSWCQLGGRLFMANGGDTLQVYDGASVSNATFTGVDLSTLNFVHVHKKRFYAIKKNSQSVFYGDPSAITGVLQELDLSTVGKFAGNLKLVATVSTTGGNDPQDMFLAIFESGDVIIYSGSDPGDAADWAEVGTFKVGRPLSRFGILPVGNDIILLTDKGYESLRVSIPNGLAQPRQKLLSNKIQQAVASAINSTGVSDDWSIEIWPIGQMQIIQLPPSAPQDQHVRNFNTGAWCEFSGLNASTFARFGQRFLYGSRSGVVRWMGAQDTDDGKSIRCDAITAWDAFRNGAYKKQHLLQKLNFETYKLDQVNVSLGIDYQEPQVGDATYVGASSEVSIWDTVEWDQCYWSGETETVQIWMKNAGTGQYSALRVFVEVKEFEVAWNSVTYLYNSGGII